MGQTSGSDRNYIYKDKSERYRYMNTFYIFAVVILWVLFGVYLLAKLASKSIAVGTAVGNVVLIILFAVVELAFYLRNSMGTGARMGNTEPFAHGRTLLCEVPVI